MNRRLGDWWAWLREWSLLILLAAMMVLLYCAGCAVFDEAFGPDAWPCMHVDHGNRAGVWESQPCD